MWAEVASELKGEVYVAQVDADASSSMRTRFSLTEYPTFLHFHAGEMRDLRMVSKTKDELVAYARGGYAQDTPSPIPRDPSPLVCTLDTIRSYFTRSYTWKDIYTIVQTILMLGGMLGLRRLVGHFLLPKQKDD